ncbi:TetR/AcrR family transcriptional regulator [Streptomyces sp. NPDC048172]|uniref:TetR/AcrR family transcriptional regulator n=1 Tax=Streptomyces sp. NPDC048172 TaxID=3365505 RepID=UPI00370FF58B
MGKEAPGRRGRPRNDEADVRIIDTALEILLNRGYDRFSVDEIATRAGVAKTTLYRRWPTKDHLIVAVVARVQDSVPVRYTGDVRADLTGYLNAITDGLHRMRRIGRPAPAAPADPADPADPGDTSAGLVAEVAAAAARHPDVGAAVQGLFARRNALVLTLLEQARDQGELRADADPEVLFDQLAGALYYRLLITGRPLDAAYVDRLVATALDGVTP